MPRPCQEHAWCQRARGANVTGKEGREVGQPGPRRTLQRGQDGVHLLVIFGLWRDLEQRRDVI